MRDNDHHAPLQDSPEQDNAHLRHLRSQQSSRHHFQRTQFETLFRSDPRPNFLDPQHFQLVVEGVPSQFRNYLWPQLVPNLCRIEPPYYHSLVQQYHQHVAVLRQEEERMKQVWGQEGGLAGRVVGGVGGGVAESDKLSLGQCELNPENTVSRLHVWLKNIKLDIPRTFPEMKIFHMDQEQYQRLANILSAFALFRGDIGYVQGLSSIAALLLQELGTEYRAFTALATLITTTCLYEFFTFHEPGIQAFCDSMRSQLRFEDEDLFSLLKENEIEAKTFVVRWVMTLFTRCFQLDSILNLWDILFLHQLSPHILQTLCVAILLARKKLLSGVHDPSAQLHKLTHSRLTPHEEEHVFGIMRSLQPALPL